MPKIVDATEVKNEILLAFQNCAKSKPLAKVTMRDIAQEAGISHPKIMYYFDSKEALIFAYIQYVSDIYSNFFIDWLDGYEKSIDEKENAIETINALLREVVVFDNQVHSKTFIQIYALAQFDEKISQLIQDVYTSWIAALENILEKLYGKEKIYLAEPLMIVIEGELLYSATNDLRSAANQNILTLLQEF